MNETRGTVEHLTFTR